MYQELAYWRDNIGLLPVNLEHEQTSSTLKYAMLDGDINNFCLGFNDAIDDNCRNEAWSSNMRNFVAVKGDQLYLFRTAKKSPEEYGYKLVKDNLPQFYKYLAIQQDNEPNTIVNFIMDKYRKIRTVMRDETTYGDSLTVLLFLLSSIDNDIDINNLEHFGLPSNTFDIIHGINNKSALDLCIEEIKKGIDGFVPNISLLLRHASGRLFEEANFSAKFDAQLSLFPEINLKYSYDPRSIGAFYTPTFIARGIVDYTLRRYKFMDKDEIVVFDPACGSGEFLVEVLRQLKSIGYKGKIKLIGYDISHAAVILSRYVLTFESFEWGNNLKFTISKEDSITNKWPSADLIFMNPPYSSWEQMDIKYRQYLREEYGEKIGKPNMASVFYSKAVRALKDDGLVGCVLPTAFLYSSYTESIRRDSFDFARPLMIARLGNFVFPKAYVDVCSVISSREKSSENTTMVWTNNVDNIVPEVIRQLRIQGLTGKVITPNVNYSVYNAEDKDIKDRDMWMPLTAKMYKMKHTFDANKEKGAFTSVGKIFEVRQGARTGANKLFKIKAEEYELLGEKEKQLFRPAVDSDSLQDNRLTPKNYLFFPYGEEGGIINSEHALEDTAPHFYKKIISYKEELINRAGIDKNKWWLLTRPRDWQYVRTKKLVSGEFGNSTHFAIDLKGDYVVERGNEWHPRKIMSDEELLFYFGIMSSSFFNDLLSLYSRQLAGGYWYNLGKKFVADIPLPFIRDIDKDLVKDIGKISNKLLTGHCINSDRDRQDRLVRYLYGQEY